MQQKTMELVVHNLTYFNVAHQIDRLLRPRCTFIMTVIRKKKMRT